jgi:hypothetical protein
VHPILTREHDRGTERRRRRRKKLMMVKKKKKKQKKQKKNLTTFKTLRQKYFSKTGQMN